MLCPLEISSDVMNNENNCNKTSINKIDESIDTVAKNNFVKNKTKRQT